MQNQYLQIYNKHFIWNHYHLFLRTNPPNHWSLPFLWTQPECDGPCQALFGRMQQISPGPCWLQSDFYFPWYGWWLKSGDHPFTGIHTSRVGAGFQPTVSPEKWWDTIPLLLGMASWGGHKKIIPWIFFPKLSRSKNFKKNWRMTLGCSPDCYVFQQQQPRASKGWQFLLEAGFFCLCGKSLPLRVEKVGELGI